jgi:hypothetical protein
MPLNRPSPAARAASKRGALRNSAPGRRVPNVPAAAMQRALANPRQATPDAIQALQARYGNRAVQRLIQTKLQVGRAGDLYEQEADRVADRVLGGNTAHSAAGALGRVQRASAGAGFEAGPEIEARLSALRGQGTPLPAGLRARMERGLNADFQPVRLHTDPESHRLNRSLRAQELAHVVQQTGAGVQRQPESEGGASALPIQRFPANVLTTPINWGAQDYSIRQSSSGAMGGVSFFRSTYVAEGEISSSGPSIPPPTCPSWKPTSWTE